MAATQEIAHEQLAPAKSAARRRALACGFVRDQALIRLKIVPAQVTLVMIGKQDLPFSPVAPNPAQDPLPPGLDGDFAAGSPERIGSGVDRVSENMVNRFVDGQLPDNQPLRRARVIYGREHDAFVAHPQVYLPDALHFIETPEYEIDRLAHPQIRIRTAAMPVHGCGPN